MKPGSQSLLLSGLPSVTALVISRTEPMETLALKDRHMPAPGRCADISLRVADEPVGYFLDKSSIGSHLSYVGTGPSTGAAHRTAFVMTVWTSG